MTTPRTDPVCGQTVDPLRARGVVIARGEPYYFCSADHKTLFAANPEKYLPKSESPVPVQVLPVGAQATAEPAAPLHGERLALRFEIGGITSSEDVERVRRAIEKVPGVETARIDPWTEVAAVTVSDASLERIRIVEAVSAAGYEATPRHRHPPEDPQALEAFVADAWRRLRLALALAGAAAVLMLVAPKSSVVFGLSSVLGAGALFGPGRRVLTLARREWPPGFNLLVALVTVGSLMQATWLLIAGRPAALSGIAVTPAIAVACALGVHWVESLARRQTGLAGRDVGGAGELIPVVGIGTGDLVRVTSGEPVPADGVVRSGAGTVDESLISGDPMPVPRSLGELVVCGTVVTSGTLVVEARRTGEDTLLSRMRSAVAEAQQSSGPTGRFSDRAARWVPAAFGLMAVMVFFGCFLAGQGIHRALTQALTIIAAACPPILALWAKTALALALARAARLGILFRNAEAVERTHEVRVVALDQSGILRQGRPTAVLHAALPGADVNRVLALAAAAERAALAEAPLSRAIMAYAEAQGILVPPADRAAWAPGLGVTAVVADAAIAVGSRRFLERERADLTGFEDLAVLTESGQSAVYVAIDGRLAGGLALKDSVDPGAGPAIARLRRAGFEVLLLTGDSRPAAEAAAAAVGLGSGEVHADLRPDEKKAAVVALHRPGAGVAAVGDPHAPTLTAADLSIAMRGGVEPDAPAGQVSILSGRLAAVAEALELGRRTTAVMRQNAALATTHHLLLALLGATTPMGGWAPALAAASSWLIALIGWANTSRLRPR